MTTYVALLRGINVGGNNIIKMAELKACFESHGLGNVRTYINSGNVLFESNENDIQKLTDEIDALLAKTFTAKPKAVVVSHAMLDHVVNKAPKGFGTKPAEYRYDVIFVKSPLTTAEAMQGMSTKEGVDQIWQGEHVIYFSRLTAKATQSRLTRIVGTPMYQNMTIRNWNTTTKLLTLV